MSFSYYGELCTELYNLTKKVGQSLGGDIEYYRERLQDCKGPILEAMVGSGRVIIPLLESGLNVDGVDYSPEMLASCRQHCKDRELKPNLYESNLLEFSLSNKYEAIIIPAGSFLLIEKRDESIAVLNRLYELLLPGGRLMLDLFLPNQFEIDGKFSGTSAFSLPNGDMITMEEKLVEVDFYNQYKVSYYKYEKWREGQQIQSELQRFALRWYGIEEFKLVLEGIGFSEVVISADFEYGTQPTNSTQKFAFEAIKK
ncbi:bifunctional 2-polyprenyl-6-hydroxyphenol methylase/3-demethylubiquinol 3-O-methyltransferase UbiG [Halalkalibacter sp. APA_J-10(15)]|uniref:class I SAM-dependent methyltransferase n=1 Tax=Halalkalibacter sp. APA_J-10(15) TaxID=2933805 RepID=UPI001FF37C6F|nr:class I SAM-dependent methyltransferase [Halalkalibacter sp. APA_J-10(15)]MCK0469865.1 class I SAM-dependent methyltransferase [Halalkalibacter sp. APA_J-10(15)]